MRNDSIEKTNGLKVITKQFSINKYNRHEPTTTHRIRAPDLGQANKEYGGMKHDYERSTLLLLMTAQHTTNR